MNLTSTIFQFVALTREKALKVDCKTSKLINVSTSKFSLSPIKHSNLATLHNSTIFCKSNLVRLLVPLLLSHSHALQSPLDSKLQTDHSPTRHLFFATLFLKNSVNLSFIHLNLTYCIPLRLPFLLYSHLNFTLSSKLISSKSHFPLVFFTLRCLPLALWPG